MCKLKMCLGKGRYKTHPVMLRWSEVKQTWNLGKKKKSVFVKLLFAKHHLFSTETLCKCSKNQYKATWGEILDFIFNNSRARGVKATIQIFKLLFLELLHTMKVNCFSNQYPQGWY